MHEEPSKGIIKREQTGIMLIKAHTVLIQMCADLHIFMCIHVYVFVCTHIITYVCNKVEGLGAWVCRFRFSCWACLGQVLVGEASVYRHITRSDFLAYFYKHTDINTVVCLYVCMYVNIYINIHSVHIHRHIHERYTYTYTNIRSVMP